jgi:hypothetical protein
VTLTLAQLWDVEHGLAPAALRDERGVAWRGCRFSATAP